mmetsp:Transcript_102257/g.286699  ORF Transcript_102257/g.286699 Transcript_102257/m.286699 type:complete len:212 (+) Transcript_102257:479-1114(+)
MGSSQKYPPPETTRPLHVSPDHAVYQCKSITAQSLRSCAENVLDTHFGNVCCASAKAVSIKLTYSLTPFLGSREPRKKSAASASQSRICCSLRTKPFPAFASIAAICAGSFIRDTPSIKSSSASVKLDSQSTHAFATNMPALESGTVPLPSDAFWSQNTGDIGHTPLYVPSLEPPGIMWMSMRTFKPYPPARPTRPRNHVRSTGTNEADVE